MQQQLMQLSKKTQKKYRQYFLEFCMCPKKKKQKPMDQQIPAAKDWRGIPAANLSGAFRDPRLTIFKLPLASFPHSCSKFIGHIGSDHSNEALIDDVRLEVMRLAFREIWGKFLSRFEVF